MQEQDYFNEDQHFADQTRWVEGVHTFQEFVYPPPLWKRVLFALLQFVLGVVVGPTLVWIMLIKGGSQLGCVTFLALLGISIICMLFSKTRFFGFGLLACILAIPILVLTSISQNSTFHL
jgi:hypothetical protein